MRLATVIFLAFLLFPFAAVTGTAENAKMPPAPQQPDIEEIKKNYQAVSAELERHLVERQWLDDDPGSPALLTRQWSLGAAWVAAWLDAHPQMTFEGVNDAIAELDPYETPEYVALDPETFLVVAPGPIGNVFIVAKTGDRYHVAWSTAQPQEATGNAAEALAAWRPENARHTPRGPYWAASGKAGPVSPRLGMLPADAKGHARFYIEGRYAQSAGATVGAQISLWVWDGITARPQLGRNYTALIGRNAGTRLEGDLFKVRQKKFFRTFYSCGECEGRSVDWIVRLTPGGMEDLGEKSAVPDLDAVDELFYRLMHGRAATDIASAASIKAAKKIIDDSRLKYPSRERKEVPNLGMLMDWLVVKDKDDDVLSFSTDDTGAYLFRLKPADNGLFIEDVAKQ